MDVDLSPVQTVGPGYVDCLSQMACLQPYPIEGDIITDLEELEKIYKEEIL